MGASKGPGPMGPGMPRTGSRVDPPAAVWWLAAYFSCCSFLALWLSLLARAGALGGVFVSSTDPTLLHALYALCWGALGACLNGAWAAAKHCAARDFDESWNWWYLAKPPMGAIVGLAVYVLSKGLGSFLGMAPATSGLGVAAVALVAGFATERVTRKIEDVSKTLFAVSEPPPTLTILEPVSGQHVAGDSVRVVVNAIGAGGYVRATCPQESMAPVDLVCSQGGLCEALLPLVGPAGPKTIRVTAVVGAQVLTAEAEFEHVGPTPAPAGGTAPAGDAAGPGEGGDT